MKYEEVGVMDEIITQDLVQYQMPNTTEEELTQNDLHSVTKLKEEILNAIAKRTIDIIGSLIGIVLLLPLTIAVAVINMFSKNDNGPIFYKQKRIGKNGKYFEIYKFRTMVVNAEDKLIELLKEDENLKKEFEANRKLKNDPRITKIGQVLRKTSLDEMPNFINVLKGEMSLVGPRAVIDGEIDLFGKYKEEVLSVKPGITGYWAANGRSNTTYDERVKMETYYARNNTLIMDFEILAKTIFSVLNKEGAA